LPVALGEAYRAGKLAAAEHDLGEALRLVVAGLQAEGLAQVYARQGRDTAAQAELARALELAPGQPELYRARAELAWERGLLDEAGQDLLQAVRLPAAAGRALADDHAKLGQLHLRARRPAEALRSSQAALQA